MTGLVNGTDLILKVNSTGGTVEPIAFSTSCSLEFTADEIDTTNKDSNGFKSITLGTRSFSLSTDALYQNEDPSADNTHKYADFFTLLSNRTKIDFEFTVSNASQSDGNQKYTGSCFLTSLSVQGGTEDQATYSASFTGTGAIIQDTVS